jgi:hypothetical protein
MNLQKIIESIEDFKCKIKNLITIMENSSNGDGTENQLVKFTGSKTIGDSLITDDGFSVYNEGTGTGIDNTVFGKSALVSNTTGFSNTVFGKEALSVSTIVNSSVAIGAEAMKNGGGNFSTAVGFKAMGIGVVTGQSNTAIGYYTLSELTSGQSNVALGNSALRNNDAGNGNTGVGTSSLSANISGNSNTGAGSGSLMDNTTGNFNSALGQNIKSGNFSGSTLLGKDATATADNQFVVGSTGTNAGALTVETNTSANVWNVIINGVAHKILLA